MVQRLKAFIKKNNWCKGNQRYLLAVSGGVDSVCMAHLFSEAAFDFALVHINFQLRGQESDDDAAFVSQLAADLKVPFYIQNYDTSKIAEENAASIQLTARKLRYAFFEEIRKRENFNWIATAHHVQDHFETLLYQLTKGTGYESIKGIPLENDCIIRPMSEFSREDILDFMQENQLPWREDSSNQKTVYQRNLIRHEILPVLEKINPSLQNTLIDTFERLRMAHRVIEDRLMDLEKKYVTDDGQRLIIHHDPTLKENELLLLINKVFGAYQFSYKQLKQIFESRQGAKIENGQYEIYREREAWMLKIKESQFLDYLIHENDDEIVLASGEAFQFDKIKRAKAGDFRNLSHEELMVDFDKIGWPLCLRSPLLGDRMKPLGMKGSKLLSDMMIDAKWPNDQKSKALVLCSADGRIIWLVGARLSREFAIDDTTSTILHIRKMIK